MFWQARRVHPARLERCLAKCLAKGAPLIPHKWGESRALTLPGNNRKMCSRTMSNGKGYAGGWQRLICGWWGVIAWKNVKMILIQKLRSSHFTVPASCQLPMSCLSQTVTLVKKSVIFVSEIWGLVNNVSMTIGLKTKGGWHKKYHNKMWF